MQQRALALLAAAVTLMAASCATAPQYGNLSREQAARMIAQRRAEIAAEPAGDYYIGRRYVLKSMRLWGYLRRPGQPWTSAQLVVMNETQKRVPDRLPEAGQGRVWGYDHNSEYIIRGRYTGRKVYDPNANAEMPEFLLTGYELKDPNPGFLYNPGEVYSPFAFPQP